MRQAQPRLRPSLFLLVESNSVTRLDSGSSNHLTHPVLWSLQVRQNTAWVLPVSFKGANGLDTLSMFFLRAMRKIQAKNIYTGIKQGGEAASRLASRSNRRQNFGGADIF